MRRRFRMCFGTCAVHVWNLRHLRLDLRQLRPRPAPPTRVDTEAGICRNWGIWLTLGFNANFWGVNANFWKLIETEGMESDYIWDPLRKKSVRNTPEEAVRQWFIGVLHEGMGVPEHMMGSEVAFSHAGKDYRADVIVYDRTAKPLMVVECKRPEVTLDQNVVDQALRYNNELNVRYIVITNGLKTFIFQRQPDGWQFMQKAPLWGEMADEKRQADGNTADEKRQADSDEMPGQAGHAGEVGHDGKDEMR